MSDIFSSNESSEESWMSISDLMAGLMIVFLFVAIAFIQGIGQEQERLELSICNDLKDSLSAVEWRRQVDVCDGGVVVKFKDPDTLFAVDESALKPRFRDMLTEFFPLYMKVINKYQNEINEVRIEGHTDDTGPFTGLERYFYNMGLSQKRTTSVMEFLFRTETAQSNAQWLIRNMTANGLSSSNPVLKNEEQGIDRDKSRRVEFRLRLKTPKRIRDIVGELRETRG